MRYPRTLLTFCKKLNSSECRCAWANYDDIGLFKNITNYYGEALSLKNGNCVTINEEVWVLKGILNQKYGEKK